jgi:hypothetical protein
LILVDTEVLTNLDTSLSHFTPLCVKKINGVPHTLMRSTCGALIGSNDFAIDHFIHHAYLTSNLVFPDNEITLLGVRSCSRPINGINNERLNHVTENLLIGTGFGGKGVTTSAVFALNASHDMLDHIVNQSEI